MWVCGAAAALPVGVAVGVIVAAVRAMSCVMLAMISHTACATLCHAVDDALTISCIWCLHAERGVTSEQCNVMFVRWAVVSACMLINVPDEPPPEFSTSSLPDSQHDRARGI